MKNLGLDAESQDTNKLRKTNGMDCPKLILEHMAPHSAAFRIYFIVQQKWDIAVDF